MKNLPAWINLLLTPVLLMIIGILLISCPDMASTLLVRILGWVFIAVGIGFVISAVLGWDSMTGKVILAAVFLLLGVWMVSRPLALAAWIGRFTGVVLILQGVRDLVSSHSHRVSVFLPVLTAVLGAVLVVLPMTASRLVFMILGAVLLILGILMLIQRLRFRRLFDEPEDPNIIDAL